MLSSLRNIFYPCSSKLKLARPGFIQSIYRIYSAVFFECHKRRAASIKLTALFLTIDVLINDLSGFCVHTNNWLIFASYTKSQENQSVLLGFIQAASLYIRERLKGLFLLNNISWYRIGIFVALSSGASSNLKSTQERAARRRASSPVPPVFLSRPNIYGDGGG